MSTAMNDYRFEKAIPILATANLPRSVQLFETLLGFSRVFVSEDTAAVTRDGVEIYLWLTSDRNILENTACRVTVSGIDALAVVCEAAGVVHPNGKLATKPWGFRELTILDPHGSAVTFVERA